MKRSLALGLAALALATPLLQGCFGVAVVGMTSAAMIAADRRSPGMYVEDEAIEWRFLAAQQEDSRGAHVNAASYNRRVLLTGEAPTEDEKARLEKLARGVQNVREVVNELVVGGVTSTTSRGNDALITTNVKSRMLNNGGRFSVNHIKVITENGTVYLLGLVTQAEADAAVDIARNTSGVQRVVKVFEYITL
jgi:osmotically-inducible protein OsmY